MHVVTGGSRTRERALAVALLGAALVLGCGRTERAPLPTAEAAVIGGVDVGDGLSNVGQMVARASPESPWVPLCSGTLIAPRVFLTAGHCPWAARVALKLPEMGVHFEPVLTSETRIITAGVWIQHPDFVNPPTRPFPAPSPANHPDLADVSVFVMDEPLDLHPALLPAEGELAALVADADGGLPIVSTAGFGVSALGQPQTADRRRSTTGRVAAVYDAWLQLEPDPGTGCSYDSGGPSFRGAAGRTGNKPFLTRVDATGTWADCATWELVYRLDTPHARSFLGQFVELP